MLFPGPYYVIKGLYFVFTQYCVVSVFITLHILLLPLRFTAPTLYWKIDAYLFKTSLGVVSSWFYTEGVTCMYTCIYTPVPSGINLSM